MRILLLLLLEMIQLQAATYYVRTDGSNSNTGLTDSAGGAWLTITKAAGTVVAGDTVIVKAGTYAEYVAESTSGTSGSPIIYEADGYSVGSYNENVVVWGFNLTGQYIKIRGFKLIGSTTIGFGGIIAMGANGNNTATDILIDDPPVFNYGCFATTVNGCYFDNIHLVNGKNHAFNLQGCWTVSTGHIITNCYLITPYGADAFRLMSSNTKIVDCVITNWSNIPISSGTLYVGLSYFFIDVSGSPDFSNIGAGAGPYTIGEAHAFTVTGTAGTSVTPNSWGMAQVINSNHPDIFQGFTSGAGAAPDRTATNNLIERNLIVNCTRTQIGIFEDQLMDGRIGNFTFRNNIFNRIEYPFHGYISDIKWYNNVFKEGSYGLGSQVIFCYPYTAGKGLGDGARLFNNIFYSCGVDPTSATAGWYSPVSGVTNFQANYNLVIGTGAGTTKTGFVTGGREANGINGSDPLFTEAAAGDFTILIGSPCINAGSDLSSSFTDDFSGNTRSVPWDIGAYEYVAAALVKSINTGTLRSNTTLR